MSANSANVFLGPSGMRDFLNPDHHIPSPLVELDSSINPHTSAGVRILAKVSCLTPLFTIKWYAAYQLLAEAYESGDLDGVEELIENSSGGTAFAMRVIAKVVFGIDRFRAIVPSDMAPGKLEGLRLMGINYEFSSGAPGEPRGPEKARIEGAKPGRFNPDQYSNDANWRGQEQWLGRQIWDQTDGKITIYTAGMGTTGTIYGPANYFRKQRSQVTIWGVMPTKDQVPGARTLARIEADVRFQQWKEVVDERIDIEPAEAYRKSLQLWRRGVQAGPSSGLALAGVLALLEKNRRYWDDYRNADGDIVVVFPCPDIPQLYSEKYSTHLEATDIG